MRLPLLLTLLLALGVPAAPLEARTPNVVLILADDLGYGELGCYGQSKIRTPNLDRLAVEGMRFTRHYAGSPVCAPSRCVLLTGRHTGHAAIRGNRELGGWGPEEPEGQWPLPDDARTLAEHLGARGYATGAFGKWGLGGPGSSGHPLRQGFDHFYGYLCQRVAHNYYPTHLWRNHDVDVLHGNRYFPAHQKLANPPDPAGWKQFRGADYAPIAIIEEALEFMREHRDRPFLLYYASIIPHAALQVPEDRVATYPASWDETPYLGAKGYLPHPRPRAAYAAMISELDRNVGRLLATIDELGLDENTVVIFTSDNGTTFNGGVDRVFFDSLGGLRGHKCTVYEGGLRVPLLVRWPSKVPAGQSTAHVSGCQDLLPTIVDLTNGEPIPDVDGVSFAPTLRADGAQIEHAYLYWEYPEGDQQQAILAGDWKGVRRNLRTGVPPLQLFDLAVDPAESTDVAREHPDVVAELERILDEARVPCAAFPIPALDDR